MHYSAPPSRRSGARAGSPLEAAALLRHPIHRGEGVAHAGGQPVLLIPGFLAGDDSLGIMTKWLRRTGHQTRKAGIRVERRLLGAGVRAADRAHSSCWPSATASRSRSSARAAAATSPRCSRCRRPDLVSGIVTLGSPQLDPLRHPPARARRSAPSARSARSARAACSALVPVGRLLRRASGTTCAATFPRDVGYVSVYSRATASWTGAPASTRRPSTSRCARATAAWRSTRAPTARSRTALAEFRGAAERQARR